MANNALTGLSLGANTLTTLPQFAGMQESFSSDEKCFAQSPLLQNNKITQIREKAFIKGLEKKLHIQEKDSSHLKSLLKSLTQLPDLRENEVHQALFKKHAYLKSLFNEVQINSYTVGAQSFSSVTDLPNDNFVVTWQSNSGFSISRGKVRSAGESSTSQKDF